MRRRAPGPSSSPRGRSRWSTVVVVVLITAWVGYRLSPWGPGDVRDDPLIAQGPLSVSPSSVVPPAAEREVPTPGIGEQATPIGLPPPVPAVGGSYAFLETQVDASGETVPIAWSPCRQIHVVVNPAGAPSDFADRVSAALTLASAYSGLRFVVDGTTDEAPSTQRAPFQPQRYGDQWVPVLIAMASAEQVPELAGDVVGVALTAGAVEPSVGLQVRVSGIVYVDVEVLDRPEIQGSPMYEAVLRHELGHMLGLGHVDDPSQLMNPTATQSLYQVGDQTGLALLGAGSCAPGV